MSLSFDGAAGTYAEFLGVPVDAAPITMACWFRSPSVADNQTLMSFGNTASSTRYLTLEAAGADASDLIKVRARADGTIASGASNTGYSADTWTHAAGLFEHASSRYAAINGIRGAQQTSSRAPIVDVTGIGQVNTSGSRTVRFTGLIAEAAIWKVFLTDKELLDLANWKPPSEVRPESLISYWPFIDPNRGTISRDLSKFGRNLTLAGATLPSEQHPRLVYSFPRRIRFPGPAAGGGTFTAAGACTAGAAICSGAATFTKPTYTGASAVSSGPATASGSATFTKPTYTGTAFASAGPATCAGVATFVAPTYTAAAAVTCGATTAAGSAIFANAVFQASAAVSIGHATAAGSATFTKPTYTGAAAVSAAPAVAAGSAIFSSSICIGAAAVTVAGATCSSVATFTAGVMSPSDDVFTFETRIPVFTFEPRSTVFAMEDE